MKNLSVRIKVLLLAAIMLVITCIVAAVGIFSNHQSKQAVDDMYNYNLMTTQYLNDATTQMRFIESDINYLLLTTYPQENKKILFEDMTGRTKSIQADMDKIKEIDRSERAQKALDALAQDTDAFLAGIEASAGLTDSAEDRAKLLQNIDKAKAINAGLSELTPDNVQQGKQLFEQSNAVYDRTIKIFLAILFAGLIIGVVVARGIARGIAGPLGESVELLDAVADGDLTREVPQELAERRDEIGTMIAALDKMQQSLRSFLHDVRTEAEQSAAMVEEVQGVVGGLKDGAEDKCVAAAVCWTSSDACWTFSSISSQEPMMVLLWDCTLWMAPFMAFVLSLRARMVSPNSSILRGVPW